MLLFRRARPGTQRSYNFLLGGGSFDGKSTQFLRHVFEKVGAQRPLAIYETANRSLVYADAPRECCGAAEKLNAISEVLALLMA